MSADAYVWYRNALAGFAPTTTEEPCAGFFRRRAHKGGPWVAAAIWTDPVKGLVCRVGNDMRDPHNEWTWLAKNPVPADQAKAFFETGKWPSEILLEQPTVGHNNPPMSLAELIAAEVEKATDWLKGHAEITTKLDCDIAANMAPVLTKLSSQADEARKDEKRPHIEAGRAVDARWEPFIASATETARKLKSAAGAWMAAQEQRLEKDPAFAGKKPKIQAGGARGSKIGLKDVWTGEVTDHALALEFYRAHPDVIQTVSDLVNKDAARLKESFQVPGAKAMKTRKAQ